MNENELNILIEKFPCVLKKAQKTGIVDICKYELITHFECIELFRGIKRKKDKIDLRLHKSDFLSQAELYYHIESEKRAIAKSEQYEASDNLKVQMDLFNNSMAYNCFDIHILGNYSCSFSDSYDKLKAFFEKPAKGRFIARGYVNNSDGILSRTDGAPGHVHVFLFKTANLKESFEVVNGNS